MTGPMLSSAERAALDRAVALFNRGDYFECHEVLEALWMARPRGDAIRAALQGWIQLAAALIKHAEGVTGGAERLCTRGAARLRGSGPHTLGFDTDAFCAAVEAWIGGQRGARPALPASLYS